MSKLQNQATSYILQDKQAEARNLIAGCLELVEDYNLPERAGLSYLNLGWLEFMAKNFKHALIAIEKSVSIFRENKARPGEIRAKLCKAVISFELDEKVALATLTESVEMVGGLDYNPCLPFEMKWAEPLFVYVVTGDINKVRESVEMFLKR